MADASRTLTEAELLAAHAAAMRDEAGVEEGNIETRAEGEAALASTLTEAELRAAHVAAMREEGDPEEAALETRAEGEAALADAELVDQTLTELEEDDDCDFEDVDERDEVDDDGVIDISNNPRFGDDSWVKDDCGGEIGFERTCTLTFVTSRVTFVTLDLRRGELDGGSTSKWTMMSTRSTRTARGSPPRRRSQRYQRRRRSLYFRYRECPLPAGVSAKPGRRDVRPATFYTAGAIERQLRRRMLAAPADLDSVPLCVYPLILEHLPLESWARLAL